MSRFISLQSARNFTGKILAATLALALAAPAFAATYTRQDNATALNAAGAWSAGGPPTTTDAGEWNGVTTNLNTGLGGNTTWGEIIMGSSQTSPVIISTNNAGSNLTLSDISGTGIDMSAAAASLTIATNISLGAGQTWNVGTGQTLTISGNINGGHSLTFIGGGTLQLGSVVSLTNLSITASSATVTATSTAGLVPGMTVAGATGIPAGTIASIVSATQFTLSVAASATSTTASTTVTSGNGPTLNASPGLALNGAGTVNLIGVSYPSPITVGTTTATITAINTNNNTFSGILTVPLGDTLDLNIGGTRQDYGVAGNISGNGTIAFGSGTTTGTLRISDPSVTTATGGVDITFNLGTNSGIMTQRTGATTTYLGGLIGGVNTLLEGGSSTAGTDPFSIGNNNSNTEFDGEIEDGGTSNPVSLIKTGTGTLTLTNTSSPFTGTTTISAGTIAVGANVPVSATSPLGNSAGAITLGNAATTTNNSSPSLVTSASATIARPVTIAAQTTTGSYSIGGSSASTSTFSGLVTTNEPLTVTQVASGTLNVTGGVTNVGTNILTFNNAGTVSQSGAAIGGGTLSVAQTGAGATTFSFANTYTGTTSISAGTLIAGANAPSGSAGAFGNAASAVTLGSAATTTNNSSPSLLIGGAFTVARPVTINNNATSGTYALGGSTTSTSTFSGAITMNQPVTFTQAASGTLNVTGGVTNVGTNTLTFNNAGSVSASGAAIGGGTLSIVQSGSGTTTFGFANTYTGTTTINAGTIAVTGSGTLGTGSVALGGGTFDISGATSSSYTLGSTQTLSGTGIVNANGGALTVNGGLTPSAITISNGGVILGSTSASTFNVASLSSYSTFILSSGLLTYGGAFGINFSTVSGHGTYHLISSTSASGDFASVTITGSYSATLTDPGNDWTGTDGTNNFDFNTATGDLVISAVPEPAVYGLVLGVAALLLSLRRRKIAAR
jgi:autotransporter-associated beta strand protein